MSSFLSLRDVWVEYGDKIVLERVNLEIDEGAFVSIIGPSGAGKSSLLRVVLGQDAPSRGRIELDGMPLEPQCDSNRGVVFQRYSVFPHMTVLENTLFGLECAQAPFTARLFGAARRAAVAEAKDMLHAVGLGDNGSLYPAQMSGGMQQRLALAQALVKRPRILLLDEPFAGIDPISVVDIQRIVRQLKARNIGILITDHNVRETLDIIDRASIIHAGELLFEGSPHEIVENAEVRRGYLGDRFGG